MSLIMEISLKHYLSSFKFLVFIWLQYFWSYKIQSATEYNVSINSQMLKLRISNKTEKILYTHIHMAFH